MISGMEISQNLIPTVPEEEEVKRGGRGCVGGESHSTPEKEKKVYNKHLFSNFSD